MIECLEAEKSLSQTQTKFALWAERLCVWQGFALILFAACMPVSITAMWVCLIAGLVLWFLQSILIWKSGCFAVPVNKTVSPAAKLGSSLFSISGLDGAQFLFPLLLFALAVFASGFAVGLSENVTQAPFQHAFQVALNSLFTLQTLLVYPWAYQAVKRAPQFAAKALAALFLVASLSCLYTPIEPEVMRRLTGAAPHYLQATGFLEQPMAFAGQLQVFLMLALALLLTGEYKRLPAVFQSKPAAIAVTLCLILGLVLASERSAWLGAIFGVIVLGSRISKKVFFSSIIGLVLVAGLSYGFVPFVQDRVNKAFSGNDQSFAARVEIYKHAMEAFKKDPIFGCGVKRFPKLQAATAMPEKGYFDHAHSNYLHVLATTGVIGLAAYLYLLAVILKTTTSLSKLHQANFNGAIALGLLAATVALCVSGLFEYNFGTGHVRLTYFFVLAFLAAVTGDDALGVRI
ncbi:MAG: hypothetical protein C0507_10615 [Cyanobacteria bacterium PR.3.49]|nr:hypothetical protein [Cyanobacteria bacterium PR.3.49]